MMKEKSLLIISSQVSTSFVETKAPEYYLHDNQPVSFSITKNQTSIVEVKKENKRGIGELTIIRLIQQIKNL